MADERKRKRTKKLEQELADAIASGDERFGEALANAAKYAPQPMTIGKPKSPQWTTPTTGYHNEPTRRP